MSFIYKNCISEVQMHSDNIVSLLLHGICPLIVHVLFLSCKKCLLSGCCLCIPRARWTSVNTLWNIPKSPLSRKRLAEMLRDTEANLSSSSTENGDSTLPKHHATLFRTSEDRPGLTALLSEPINGPLGPPVSQHGPSTEELDRPSSESSRERSTTLSD